MKNIFIICLIILVYSCDARAGIDARPIADTLVKDTVWVLSSAGTSYSSTGDTILTRNYIFTKSDTFYKSDVTIRKYVPQIVIPPTTGTRKNLMIDESFELANAISKWGSEICCSYSTTISKDFARTGSSSYKVYLKKSDPDVAGSKRAEIKQPKEKANNVERWYGVSFLFPAGYKADPSCPEIVFQWHHNSGTGSPPLALWSYGSYLSFNQYNISAKKDGLTKLIDITPGKWMDVVFHIKFSPGSDGLTEVWVNGVKKYSKPGVNNYSNTAGYDYLKTGLYKWGWKSGYKSTVTERTIYIDDIRIGNQYATYNDVAP